MSKSCFGCLFLFSLGIGWGCAADDVGPSPIDPTGNPTDGTTTTDGPTDGGTDTTGSGTSGGPATSGTTPTGTTTTGPDPTGTTGGIDTDTTGTTTGPTTGTTTGTPPECGDGAVEGDEECDDGNLEDGDGCEADCTTTPDPCGPVGAAVYVDIDATGAGDGTSWADAYTSVFPTIQSAGQHDQIWIAEGTYRSIAANTPVANLKSCVDVYGGFVGTETALDERPVPRAETIFDGDYLGDDAADGYADNATHVVTGVSTDHVTLDGIILTGGRATANGQTQGGGFFLATSVGLKLVDLTLRDNVAGSMGGGLYADEAELTLDNTVFVTNTSSNLGGGLYAENSTLVLTDAVFDTNVGQGMHASETAFTMTGSRFVNNTGGGLWTGGAAEVTIATTTFETNHGDQGGGAYISSPGSSTDVVFTGNTAATGGGVHVSFPASGSVAHTFERAQFLTNTATSEGGGLFLSYGSSTSSTGTVVSSLFQGNRAPLGGAIHTNGPDLSVEDTDFGENTAESGGAIFVALNAALTGDVTLKNSTFTANIASDGNGGAIAHTHDPARPLTAHISSCTFVDNSATGFGGAIHLLGRGAVRNCLFQGNMADDGAGLYVTPREQLSLVASSTFHQNTAAAGKGGGIAFVAGDTNTSTVVRNVAMWDNGVDTTGEALADVSYTCGQKFQLGAGNVVVSSNPFVPGPAGEVFLDQTSVCVDAGDDSAATEDYTAIGSDWTALTTDMTGTLDTTPVDTGVHHAP